MTDRFSFSLDATDGRARMGRISTPRGEVRTPAFMPVGTAATVKAMLPDSVRATGADILLGNTYHLMLRPTAERIHRLGKPIERNACVQVMNMMVANVAREPLQHLGQLVEGTAAKSRLRVVPVRLPLPLHVLELVLHIEQPHAARRSDQRCWPEDEQNHPPSRPPSTGPPRSRR